MAAVALARLPDSTVTPSEAPWWWASHGRPARVRGFRVGFHGPSMVRDDLRRGPVEGGRRARAKKMQASGPFGIGILLSVSILRTCE
jgi:hypothetical protein